MAPRPKYNSIEALEISFKRKKRRKGKDRREGGKINRK